MKNNIIKEFFKSIGLVALGVGLILAFPAPGLPAAPKVSLPQSAHDFGLVSEDTQMTHTFVIRNDGDAPLEIASIDPDCACTAADYDKQIPPRSQGKITLSIKPFSVLRQFTKRTKVFTNDPERQQFELVFKGEVRPFIEIKPSHIIHLKGAGSDDLKGQIHFTSNLMVPWQIVQYRSSLQAADVEISLQPEVPDKVYVLEVKNKRLEAGRYAGVVELFTTSTARPRLIVRVFGDIY